MSAHAFLPPSGAAAWRQCAAWPLRNAQFPQDDTPATLEGTAAHWVFEQMLAKKPVAVGHTAPNGFVVTAEMMDGAELVVDVVAERIPYAHFGGLHVEEPVDCSRIHPACWGTPDIWSYSPSLRRLVVVDYKFGHRFVEEFENDQLVTYVGGILYAISDKFKHYDTDISVELIVVQPRCFYRGAPVRTWRVAAVDLRAQLNILAAAAVRAHELDPVATVNDECVDCPGRHACPALQRAAYRAASVADKSSPVVLDSAAASLELRMLEAQLGPLTARVEGLREVVAQAARAGQPVPFHRLESTVGRQVWTVPADQVFAIGDLCGVDLRKPATLTPKQAIAAGVDGAVIAAYSNAPTGALRLVPENPADARRVFGIAQE